MRKYELLYVLNPQLGAEGLTEMNEKIQNMVKEAAQNVEVDDWGIKQLAYEIEDQREGNYVIVQFESDAEFPSELERVLRINDKVLRFLVTRVDA